MSLNSLNSVGGGQPVEGVHPFQASNKTTSTGELPTTETVTQEQYRPPQEMVQPTTKDRIVGFFKQAAGIGSMAIGVPIFIATIPLSGPLGIVGSALGKSVASKLTRTQDKESIETAKKLGSKIGMSIGTFGTAFLIMGGHSLYKSGKNLSSAKPAPPTVEKNQVEEDKQLVVEDKQSSSTQPRIPSNTSTGVDEQIDEMLEDLNRNEQIHETPETNRSESRKLAFNELADEFLSFIDAYTAQSDAIGRAQMDERKPMVNKRTNEIFQEHEILQNEELFQKKVTLNEIKHLEYDKLNIILSHQEDLMENIDKFEKPMTEIEHTSTKLLNEIADTFTSLHQLKEEQVKFRKTWTRSVDKEKFRSTIEQQNNKLDEIKKNLAKQKTALATLVNPDFVENTSKRASPPKDLANEFNRFQKKDEHMDSINQIKKIDQDLAALRNQLKTGK